MLIWAIDCETDLLAYTRTSTVKQKKKDFVLICPLCRAWGYTNPLVSNDCFSNVSQEYRIWDFDSILRRPGGDIREKKCLQELAKL